jgi:F5/8 type C domain
LLQIAAAVAVLLLAYALFSDKNIALGKTVTASSIGGFSPEALPQKGRLSRMVDGNVLERWAVGVMTAHGLYAGGTEREMHPWITVDLGRTRTINKVVVYNRADCCWGAADIPLSLQLSSDNQTFETVATRDTEFKDDFPWRQPVGGRKARYVRLWSPAETPKEIVLSEIEVYGR